MKSGIFISLIMASTLFLGCEDTDIDSNLDSDNLFNKQPEAEAKVTGNTTFVVSDTIMLNGGESTDEDGDSLTYSWRIKTTPNQSNATLINETSATPSFIADIPGEYAIELIVNDGIENSRPDSVYITVVESLVTHDELEYGVIVSEDTGRKWLDRNIGSTEVCRSYRTEDCYGDYFQWGRGIDGHEQANSLVSDILATDIDNSGSRFIAAFSADNFDWVSVDLDGTQRAANWSATDGSSVCPVDFRVPTINELEAENISNQRDGSINNLNIPAAGYKNNVGELKRAGDEIYLLSTTIDDINSSKIFSYAINEDAAQRYSDNRVFAQSVRCIED